MDRSWFWRNSLCNCCLLGCFRWFDGVEAQTKLINKRVPIIDVLKFNNIRKLPRRFAPVRMTSSLIDIPLNLPLEGEIFSTREDACGTMVLNNKFINVKNP